MEKKDDIRNLVFDLGGILVGLDSRRCIEAFHAIGAHAVASYVADHRVEDLFLDLETGRIDTPAFCAEVRRLTGSQATDRQVCDAWNALLTTIPTHKTRLLQDLGCHYRLFLLSNTNDIHWQHCARYLFPDSGAAPGSLFERVFLSYEMHLSKPSEDIFREVARQAGIQPEETLFIDDNADNCEAAARTGYHTLHDADGTAWPAYMEQLAAGRTAHQPSDHTDSWTPST